LQLPQWHCRIFAGDRYGCGMLRVERKDETLSAGVFDELVGVGIDGAAMCVNDEPI
jgi:lipid-binding SYLF domain-containing protein